MIDCKTSKGWWKASRKAINSRKVNVSILMNVKIRTLVTPTKSVIILKGVIFVTKMNVWNLMHAVKMNTVRTLFSLLSAIVWYENFSRCAIYCGCDFFEAENLQFFWPRLFYNIFNFKNNHLFNNKKNRSNLPPDNFCAILIF